MRIQPTWMLIDFLLWLGTCKDPKLMLTHLLYILPCKYRPQHLFMCLTDGGALLCSRSGVPCWANPVR